MAGPSRSARATQLPEAVARMQTQIETLYLSRLELEQEVLQLRATQPVVMCRPPAPSLPMRILMRLSGRLRRRYHLRLLRQCGLFDPDWYLKTYEDVRAAGLDPAMHYLLHGASDLRNPGPHFDTAHYLHLYPDIAENGMNPLIHYIISGHAERRSIRPGMPHGG